MNAVDVERTRKRVLTIREAEGGVARPPQHRFVYVGQLIARKNVAVLLRAFACLARPASLTVVGAGPEEEALRSLAHELGIEGRVCWLGMMSPEGVDEVLAKVDTLVLPSYEEVWGMVVNEGLAAGLNIVLSRCCGVFEAVSELPGIYGFDPASVEELLGALSLAAESPAGWDMSAMRTECLSPRRAAEDLLHAIRLAHISVQPSLG